VTLVRHESGSSYETLVLIYQEYEEFSMKNWMVIMIMMMIKTI